MPTVEILSPDELRDRREALLARAGMTDVELRARGASYALTPDQAALLDELERIDFLLGA